MSREEKNSLMLSLVDQWKQSRLSQVEFAKANDINHHTFKYWVYKRSQIEDASSSFIQINNSGGAPICLRYPNGVELLFPIHTPVDMIKELADL